MNDDGVTESSGNVFADLGFEDPEEELLKANLSRQLRAILKERSLTEREAADTVGLMPEDISAIAVGRTDKFTIEHLVRCLDRLDYRIDVVVRRKAAAAAT